jgi:hypothetical protein
VSNDIPEVQDHSRVDAFAAARRRAMVLHSAWRPMLAGAAGAALVVAAVYVTLPKFSVREVVVDHVVTRDVPLNNPVPRDVPFDVPVPRVAPSPPVATNPPKADAPRTPAEKRFTDTPAYKRATYRGRIVPSTGGGAISFADGMSFSPAHWDEATSQPVYDSDESFDTDALVGDLCACVQDAHGLWECTAEHAGHEVSVGLKQKTARVSPPAPAPSPPRDSI